VTIFYIDNFTIIASYITYTESSFELHNYSYILHKIKMISSKTCFAFRIYKS